MDWDAIADSLGHDKSAMECFMMYRNQTCPSINRGAWTAEEVQRLTILAEKYDCHEWPLVATELGTDRTPLACLEYFQRHLNSARMTNSAGFSTEEDEVLRDAARFYAHPCHLYASSCLQTRLPQQCCDRLRKLQPQTEPHIDHVGSSPDTLGDDCASTFLAEEAEARRARFERSGSTYRRPSGVVATTTWTRREEKLLFLAALAHRMPMNADNKRPAVDIERLAALPAADVVSIRALVEGAGACGSAPGASASTSDTSSATATTDTGSAEVRGRKRKAATAVSVGAPAAKVRSAAAKSWAPVAALVPGRTEVQCREKWGNTLDPTLNLSLEYSPEEDAALLKLLPVIGVGRCCVWNLVWSSYCVLYVCLY